LFGNQNRIFNSMEKTKIIVAVTGASGSIFGWRLLEKLRKDQQVETHLVLSRSAERTAWLELGKKAADFRQMADFSYPFEDIGARLASGSFRTTGMIVAPCSIQTMSAIALGVTDTLITRAADVVLKERRRLILMVREMPFHLGHLRNMVQLTEMGAIIAPPVPGFYQQPQTVLDLVDHCVDRVLDLMDLPPGDAQRWDGSRKEQE
jgi:4-hydroxy-3-polyprenylbenzoate decarboxylase